jgi:DNA-binding transcriptional LysR family regulator
MRIEVVMRVCSVSRKSARRTVHDFRRAGVTRTIAVEVSVLTTVPSHVGAGLGVALVPPVRTDAAAPVVVVLFARPEGAAPVRALDAFVQLIPVHTTVGEHH